MQLEIARFLTSKESQAALEELAVRPAGLKPTGRLATLSLLRRIYGPEEAAGLLEVAVARQRAAASGKFSRAGQMFFTRTALEQASGETIAAYRARRMCKVLPPDARVADLGCGIGGDSLELARFFRVTGVDLDPARLFMAQANVSVYDLAQRFTPLQTDINFFDPSGYDALFFDPARRTTEGRRLFSVEDYTPPLSIIKKWLERVPNIAVKISPGIKYEELSGYDCEVEIISESGDVKEAVLWFGALRSTGLPGSRPLTRRATLLPAGHTLIGQLDKAPVPVVEPQAILYEPDGAVIRAGLVEELALKIGAAKLDPDIAFLTATHPVETPFARSFQILESFPFNLKRLRLRLRELGVGSVIVKKRGSPLDPQELERALKLKGPLGAEVIIVLTHLKGVHSAIICQPQN